MKRIRQAYFVGALVGSIQAVAQLMLSPNIGPLQAFVVGWIFYLVASYAYLAFAKKGLASDKPAD